jgi:endonuclease YncB( thermonuclease family)
VKTIAGRLLFPVVGFFVAVMMFSVLLPYEHVKAASTPLGIPSGATPVKVHRVIDGDQVYIDLGNGTLEHVLLAGIDAPNEGDCFYDEAKTKLTDLLPAGATIYLEASGSVDRENRLPVRYIWLPGTDGAKAVLVNTKLVREGDAGFDGTLDTPKYYDNLEAAQAQAQSKENGVWGACGELHLATEPPVDIAFVLEATAAANNLLTQQTNAYTGDYVGWLSTQASTVTSSVGQLGLIMATFTSTSFADPQWVSSVTALADLWTTAYDSAVAVTPPAEYQSVHTEWLQAMQHYANAANYLNTGLANWDPSSVSSAANELTLGSLIIADVSGQVDLSFGQ